jgi:hypothetical protein
MANAKITSAATAIDNDTASIIALATGNEYEFSKSAALMSFSQTDGPAAIVAPSTASAKSDKVSLIALSSTLNIHFFALKRGKNFFCFFALFWKFFCIFGVMEKSDKEEKDFYMRNIPYWEGSLLVWLYFSAKKLFFKLSKIIR